MSGHSKWSTIKRKKEGIDAARGKIFTKIGREITVAVREGGPDPNNNSKLQALILKAKANNVPNDNIDRTIKKAAGMGDKTTFEDIVYEGYGPCGIAVIVETLTDNRNRTAGKSLGAVTISAMPSSYLKSSPPASITSSISLSSSRSSSSITITPLRSNMKETQPFWPRFPPNLSK